MTLPDGWSTTTLAECQARTNSLDPRLHQTEDFDLFSVPSYSDQRPEAVLGREIGSTKQQVQEGDVLLCKIVPHIRRGWVVPPSKGRRQIASGEWIVFRDHGLEPEYLRRFVLSDMFHEQFMRTVSGVGGSLMRARPAEAGKIEVPVPPLAEQRRIVAKMEVLTARINRVRAELDRVPKDAQVYKTAALKRVFQDPSGPTQSLGEVAELITGFAFQSKSFVDSGVKVVRIADICERLEKWNEGSRSLPIGYLQEFDRFRVQAGDVLLALSGSVGKCGLYACEEPALLNQRVARLRSRSGLHSDQRLILRFLQFASSRIEAEAYGGAQPNISPITVRSYRVLWPEAVERASIAYQLDAAFLHADRLAAEANRARILMDRFEAAILAKAFRGELVPQDPEDEPASVLLDRIRALRQGSLRPSRRRQKVVA